MTWPGCASYPAAPTGAARPGTDHRPDPATSLADRLDILELHGVSGPATRSTTNAVGDDHATKIRVYPGWPGPATVVITGEQLHKATGIASGPCCWA